MFVEGIKKECNKSDVTSFFNINGIQSADPRYSLKTLVSQLFFYFIMPQTLQMFTGNGIVMSSITAIILNLIFNGLKKDEEIVEEAFKK